MTSPLSRPFAANYASELKQPILSKNDESNFEAGTVTFKATALQELSDMISDRDPVIIKELVDAFIGEATRQTRKMAQGIRNDDLSLLFLPAHSLKSSSATFGAMRLAKLSQRLEDILTSTGDKRALANLVEQIEAEFAKVTIAMQNALAEWRA